ncbi:uncharacterized protein RJT21DRAFT_45424 [Scheffersomyces amazonensis]|uniref:uncharacterized protein n=1 Tax=Scheffersomyces amazonensis TaxID=1078765 RepID=UPI00315C8C8E
MLQARQISQLLSQGLNSVTLNSTTTTNLGNNNVVGTTTNVSPIAISLLSSEGIPLTTVVNSNQNENKTHGYDSDSLKIYSLLGYKQLQGNQSDEPHDIRLDDWDIIQLDEELKLIIRKINYGSANNDTSDLQENGIEHREHVADTKAEDVHINQDDINGNGNSNSNDNDNDNDYDNENAGKQLYVVLYYSSSLPDSIAKLKVDNLSQAINEGLQGCSSII